MKTGAKRPVGSFTKLKSIFEGKESFLLVCHIEPDGDAVGSMLALGALLERNNKRVHLVCKDDIPAVFRFMAGSEKIKNELPLAFDAVILLDNGDLRRTGFPEEISQFHRQKIPVINIDHHQKNDVWKVVSVNYSDESASSASELVFDLAKGLNWQIDSNIATDLLAGLYNDTGGFRHSNTTEKVFCIFSELLKRGARLNKISESIENCKSISLLKLWGIALDRMFTNENIGLAISVITQQDLLSIGAKDEDTSGLINLMNSSPELNASLLLCETKDGKIKGSLRTEKDNIDLAKLAAILGGGGHRKAAGFTVDGKLEREGNVWRVI